MEPHSYRVFRSYHSHVVSDVVGKDTLRPTHFGRNRFHTLLLYRTRQNENASADRASGTDEINMSHELRTPLSLILAPLEELVEEKSKFDLQEQQKLSYIYRNGRKLLHLINQLLDFRKAESGALPIHVAMNQVDKLAKNIFTMFEENAQKRNITYEYQSDLKDDLLPVDKMYVEMMLTNLLSNAFKFTRNGGKITLSVWRKENSFGFSAGINGFPSLNDCLSLFR